MSWQKEELSWRSELKKKNEADDKKLQEEQTAIQSFWKKLVKLDVQVFLSTQAS
ncbi:MAG: hypothetical protein HQK60_16615 [Deltaproteobacteria bacterium]|nr:hypothetical protein [Deltaproteobacteria bacterium]